MAEETTYYELAQPEEGAKNSGIAINGDLDIIDLEIRRARMIMTKNGQIMVKNGDVLWKTDPVT